MTKPLDAETRGRLSELDAAIWRRSRDRFGHSHAFPNKIAEEDALWVIAILEEHELPRVLASGPYGDLSMAIYDHCDAPGVRPPIVIWLSENHLRMGHRPTFEDWRKTFDYFAKWTHSARNREILKHYGLPAPREASYYEY